MTNMITDTVIFLGPLICMYKGEQLYSNCCSYYCKACDCTFHIENGTAGIKNVVACPSCMGLGI